MFQGILIIGVFLALAALMFRQKISTFLALLIFAILIPIIARVPLTGAGGILQIIEGGSTRLASAIMALIFGAWLSEVMNETGISKDIIRRASELAGDKPLAVGIVMAAVVALLFTTLTGLGSHIMVAMLVLPIMSAVGIKPIPAACILLMARATGGIFNLFAWQLYINVAGVPLETVRNLAAVISICTAVVMLGFIIYQLKLKRRTAWTMPNEAVSGNVEPSSKKVPIYALITPLIPFPLVIFLSWPIVPALLAGVLFGVLTTSARNMLHVLIKTITEGVKMAAPAIILMMVIGMVLAAVGAPLVSESLLGIVSPILPANAFAFALFFIVLAPLSLYRGPLNLWGMGAGVIGLMVTAGTIPAVAVVCGFISVNVMQIACDPTNTHNVWTADFLGIEVNAITKMSIVPLWIAGTLSILIGAFTLF